MRRTLPLLVAVALVSSVVWAAPAGAKPASNGTMCLVLDLGGPDDPFNASAIDGLKQAKSKFKVDTVIAESDTIADITANLDMFVTSGECDLIMGVGFIVGFVMEPFVVANNPGQRFAVLDSEFAQRYPNAAEVVFAPNEASFLAGYIAAGISETGKVGTFGGVPIQAVTIWMDGYALGVEAYNDQYGADVEVLGWDPDTQSGLFAFTNNDQAIGYALGNDLMDQGVDTILPVAGSVGLGTLQAAQERKAAGEPYARIIGVDIDWYEAFGDPSRVILTSVVKDPGVGVFNQVAALVDGTWSDGFVEEDLASGGVDIAPFHKLNRDVPGFLKKDLKAIRAGIGAGSIHTLP